jgi:hypothetical protein
MSYPSQSDRQALLLLTLSLTMQLCRDVYGEKAVAAYQVVVGRYVPVAHLWQVTHLLRQLGGFHESRREYRLALKFYAQALTISPLGKGVHKQKIWYEAKKFL